MNWHDYFSTISRPVEACLAGVGEFGRSFLSQCGHTPLLNCRVAVDRNPQAALNTLTAIGVPEGDIQVCGNRAQARQAWDSGAHVVSADIDTVLELPLDILVEATGSPEGGAVHATRAIDAGWHVALISKEVDSIIGPGLVHQAAAAGKIVTSVDGDQPNLLIGLITWAQVLGLEIIAAGKSSEYDFVHDPATREVTSNRKTARVDGLSECWNMTADSVHRIVRERAERCAAFPQRAVPDFCEMQLVGNATGLRPDVPAFHAPILRIPEVPLAFRPQSEGGLLQGTGRLEFFHCLREPDELSFAGGVFLVVRCHDEKTWEVLREKGHIVAPDTRTALVYLSRHLLGLEAAMSILEAAGLGISSRGTAVRPILDMVGRAEVDLPAGTRFEVKGHHRVIQGLTAELHDAKPLGDDAPVPFYLLTDQRLCSPVAAGSLVRGRDVAFDDSVAALLRMRRYQDDAFPHT